MCRYESTCDHTCSTRRKWAGYREWGRPGDQQAVIAALHRLILQQVQDRMAGWPKAELHFWCVKVCVRVWVCGVQFLSAQREDYRHVWAANTFKGLVDLFAKPPFPFIVQIFLIKLAIDFVCLVETLICTKRKKKMCQYRKFALIKTLNILYMGFKTNNPVF